MDPLEAELAEFNAWIHTPDDVALRPGQEIDRVQFERLCALQCPKDEICAYFEMSGEALDRWCGQTYGDRFRPTFEKARQIGLKVLRR